MDQVTIVGLDLAKRVFQVHGATADGGIAIRKKLSRGQVLAFFADLPPCVVAREACATAHYWAREIGALGHNVRLVPPAVTKPLAPRFMRPDCLHRGVALSSSTAAAHPAC